MGDENRLWLAIAASQAPRWTSRPRLELRCGWPELLPAGRPKAIKKKGALTGFNGDITI